ncbi:MAG: ankyrin repeat domain-containing protein, partial [Bacteroidetes bacterium]|nr:ankyrin repeat domain-containing protein [Bacteroidota bacterium]
MTSKSSIVDFAERNDVSGIQKLLMEGANINMYTYGYSALHAACITNSLDAAIFLIKNGINTNAQDERTHATPLHYCAQRNFLVLAKLILENDGKLEMEDSYGNQPLWIAVFNVKGLVERLPIVELYLKHKADKHHKNKANRSALDFAIQVGMSVEVGFGSSLIIWTER